MELPRHGRRGKTRPSPDTTGYQMKSPELGTGHLYSSCECSSSDPSQTLPLSLPWFPSRTRWRDSIAADAAYLSPKTWGNQAGVDLETSFPLASLHSAERFYACNQGRKLIQSPTLLLNTASNHKDWPGDTCPLAQSWQDCLGSKQQLSDWI